MPKKITSTDNLIDSAKSKPKPKQAKRYFPVVMTKVEPMMGPLTRVRQDFQEVPIGGTYLYIDRSPAKLDVYPIHTLIKTGEKTAFDLLTMEKVRVKADMKVLPVRGQLQVSQLTLTQFGERKERKLLKEVYEGLTKGWPIKPPEAKQDKKLKKAKKANSKRTKDSIIPKPGLKALPLPVKRKDTLTIPTDPTNWVKESPFDSNGRIK